MSEEIIVTEAEQAPKNTYHVQVRIYKSGGPSKDGRRGKIVIEDREAPPEVARWLASAECCRGSKATLHGNTVDVWVDHKKIGDTSIDVPNADEAEEAPTPPPSASLAIPAATDARYWRDMAALLEAQFKKDKARFDLERAGFEDTLDDLAKRIVTVAEESEKRIAAKLQEEEKIMVLANGRLAALHEELQRQSERRSASMDALDRDSTVFEDLRTKLAEVENKGVLDQVIEISKDPEALQGLAGAAQVLVGLWSQIKAGGTPV